MSLPYLYREQDLSASISPTSNKSLLPCNSFYKMTENTYFYNKFYKAYETTLFKKDAAELISGLISFLLYRPSVPSLSRNCSPCPNFESKFFDFGFVNYLVFCFFYLAFSTYCTKSYCWQRNK